MNVPASECRRVALVALTAAGVLVSTMACAGSSRGDEKKDGALSHYQLARMHFEQGRITESMDEIERSLEIDDALPQVHNYQGYIYWNLAEWEQAAASFERALELQPYFTDARMFLATCYEQLGRIDSALAELDRAAQDRTYASREKIYFNRAMIVRNQGRLGDALEDLRRSVEIRPRYYRAHYEMAKILDELGKRDECLDAFESAEPGLSGDGAFLYDYGSALFRSGRKDDAAIQLRKLMEIAPGSESASKARELLDVIG